MNQRLQRLADQIQRILATLIRDEIKDPRLTGLVTISGVRVSPDLGYADIYVTVLEPSATTHIDADITDHALSLQILNNAAGFLRSELSHSLKTRTTPRLRFHYDEVVAHGNHMMALINNAIAKSEGSQTDDTEDADSP